MVTGGSGFFFSVSCFKDCLRSFTLSSVSKVLYENVLLLQQEGSLCAQHCLNNLLQGEYFTPVDLSSIAHQLDEEERMRMAEGGLLSEEYRTFLQV